MSKTKQRRLQKQTQKSTGAARAGASLPTANAAAPRASDADFSVNRIAVNPAAAITGHARTAAAVPPQPPLPQLPPVPPLPPARVSGRAPVLFASADKLKGKVAAPPPRRTLDASWYQWIAENRLRDCTAESMLATMTRDGLDRAECEAAIAAMELSPAYLAARKYQQLQRKLESVMANQQKVWELAPDYGVVEKRSNVSRDEFFERYVRGSRPLVLTDIARDWPALQRWSPQYLKERFGAFEAEVQAERNADPKFEQNKLNHKRKVRVGDFVDQVLSGGVTNDYYLTANNELLRTPEFAPLLDDIGTLPDYCNRAELPRLSWFWFGPAGTHTPLHHDTVLLLHTQVFGRKRWRFISPLETPRLYNYADVFSPIDLDHPDYNRYPLLRGVKVLEVVVEPGETVFLPLAWWHQVTGLEISMSFSYTNLDVPNDYTYANPQIYDW
jgi:hypothetical protein